MKTKTLFTFIFLLFTCAAALAEIRYVSKTGTATPPYTTWATASDSIQKCVNICNDGDTVVVDNGVYKEYLLISKEIALLGSSMDSTIIDGTGLGDYYTIRANADVTISGFTIIGKGFNTSPYYDGIVTIFNNLNVFNCKITHCNVGLWVGQSSGIIDGLIINDVYGGITTSCASDTCKPIIRNCVIILEGENADNGILNFYNGQPTILNNIIIGNKSVGINNVYAKRMVIENNLIAGNQINIWASSVSDSTFIYNNILRDQKSYNSDHAALVFPNRRAIIKNNILTNCKKGVEISTYENPRADFNLYWENEIHSNNGSIFGANDIFADPMFVKDTVAKSLAYDYHLQKYSPAIDAGDPTILDVDGSRSDIGLFGGPLGEKYTYQDLAPRNPINVTAVYQNGLINLKWNKNTEADLFRYILYRDTVEHFIPDTTKILAVLADTVFNDNLNNMRAKTYYYKAAAVDSAGNRSGCSEEAVVTITGLGEMPPKIVEDYKLMPNYPNPFNPSTKIGYRLKEPGYVKLMVYNILGERVAVLVNKYEDKGYHEVEFTSKNEYLSSTKQMLKDWETGFGDTASGIYLYRIEVIGKGNIPVFMDMRKMILVK